MATSQPIKRGCHGIREQHHVGDEKADGAQEVQGLVDAAVMVVAVIVPSLRSQFLPEISHEGSSNVRITSSRNHEANIGFSLQACYSTRRRTQVTKSQNLLRQRKSLSRSSYSSQRRATVPQHENHDRHRRMVSADQRRGEHLGSDRRVARPLRSRGADADAPRLSQRRLSHLSGNPAVAAAAKGGAARSIRAFAPQALHIATEGPLGLGGAALLSAAAACVSRPRTTPSFPQYLRARFPVPLVRLVLGAALVSRRGGPLHGEHRRRSAGTSASRGFKNLAAWRRGVDTDVFKPHRKDFLTAAAADRRLRRPGCGREEHRRVPADAVDRQQDRHRRRP